MLLGYLEKQYRESPGGAGDPKEAELSNKHEENLKKMRGY
jgi:hypothetical protein